MSKARTLADFISDGSEFADGTISVAEVSGAAPLESPSFTGSATLYNASASATLRIETDADAYASISFLNDQSNWSVGVDSADHFYVYDSVNASNVMEFGNNDIVFNQTGKDYDFRVESDTNTHMLFVDASTDHVSIGNATTQTGAGERLKTVGNVVFANANDAGNSAFLFDPDAAGTWLVHNSYYSSGWRAFDGTYGGVSTHYRGDNRMVIYGWPDNGGNDGGSVNPTNHIDFDFANGDMAFNQNSNNIDFRVESDSDTNMLYVDAENNRVSVGGGGPQARFNVFQNLNNSSDWWTNTRGALYLQNLNSSGHTVVKFNNETNMNASVVFNSTSSSGFQLFDRTSVEERLGVDSNELVINEGGQDFDFRVESQNFNDMLFVDASENAVGIGSGTTLPTTTATWRHLFIGGNLAFMSNTTVNEDVYMFSNMYYNNDFIVRNDGKVAYLRMDDGILYFAGSSATQTAGASATYNNFMSINPANETVFNQDGLNHDFRVESDAYSHMIFVDASENRVAIGHSNSAGYGSGHVLSVAGGSTQFSNFGEDVTMMIRGGNYTDPNTASVLLSGGYGDTGYIKEWLVSSVASGGGGAINNDLKFRYVAGGSATQYEALKLRYNGEVIVNEDGWGTHDFRVESGNSTSMLFVDAGDDRVFIAGQTDGNSALNPSVLHVGAYAGRNGIKVELNSSANFVAFSGKGGNTDWYYGHMVNPSNSAVGNIVCNNTSTSYNTSSDYRLKENVIELTGATERLKQLKPSRFNFITDPDKTVDGFLAHEVQTVVPEAIHGVKDEVDAEGKPVHQGIDQSKLVPLLVATIKELEARITALENA